MAEATVVAGAVVVVDAVIEWPVDLAEVVGQFLAAVVLVTVVLTLGRALWSGFR